MGLDTVELVLRVEEEFEIEIPNDIAAQLSTAGDIHNFIMSNITKSSSSIDTALDVEIWERLRDIIVEQLGVRPEEVKKSSRIVADLGAD